MANKEVWRDIEGYPGYQVSNMGRVKSLNYRRSGKEHLLVLSKNIHGYLYVGLQKNGKQKIEKVHRLVANAFIPNTENKPCVDHIDTNKENNSVTNLRWATYQENSNNPTSREKHLEAAKENIIKANESNKKPVKCLTTGKIYDSLLDAELDTGVAISGISKCCKGQRQTAGKMKWKYI